MDEIDFYRELRERPKGLEETVKDYITKIREYINCINMEVSAPRAVGELRTAMPDGIKEVLARFPQIRQAGISDEELSEMFRFVSKREYICLDFDDIADIALALGVKRKFFKTKGYMTERIKGCKEMYKNLAETFDVPEDERYLPKDLIERMLFLTECPDEEIVPVAEQLDNMTMQYLKREVSLRELARLKNKVNGSTSLSATEMKLLANLFLEQAEVNAYRTKIVDLYLQMTFEEEGDSDETHDLMMKFYQEYGYSVMTALFDFETSGGNTLRKLVELDIPKE